MNKLGSDLADAWLNKKLVDLNKFNNNEIPKTREEAYKALNIFYKKLNKKTVGWKIGAVAKEVQKEEGFDGPVPGKIFEETILEPDCEIKFDDIPASNLECEYAFKFNKDYKIDDNLNDELHNLSLFTAIDITSSRYVQSSKEKFSKLTQMYLGISDHGNGGKIIIGNEIKNWKNVEINNVKITLKINDQLNEPFFTGSKRIDPKISLKAFIDEFKEKRMIFNKGDYLLCGSLTQPYSIRMNDKIVVNYENLGNIKIKVS